MQLDTALVPGYQEENAIKSDYYIVSRGTEYGSVSVTRMESGATEIIIKNSILTIAFGGQGGR